MAKTVESINLLEKAMRLVGKKHDFQILDAINKNNKRAGFNKILKAVPSLNPRILSLRLKGMESNKLITKNLVLGTPVKTEYALTSRAEELIEIIEKLKSWAEKH